MAKVVSTSPPSDSTATTSTGTVTATVPARAAIAGNPSDGHGGAVVATVVSSVAATVTASPSDRFEIAGFDHGDVSIDEVVRRVDADGCGDVQPLVPAALTTLHRRLGADIAPLHIDVTTTIPRSVGLAGSSAIVIATMRAAAQLHGSAPWATTIENPSLLASLALAAERDVLGITAGLQDRVVQSFGGTVSMEFGAEAMRPLDHPHLLERPGAVLRVGSYRRLGPLPEGMFVAFRPDTAGDSGAVHAAVDPADADVRRTMRRAADAARAATVAITAGDTAALGSAMNATFDERAAVMELDPRHVEMVEMARATRAAANYTGSGGAVVVLAPDGRARTALEELGCRILAL
mgnify:CR=1 FL=1